MFAIIPTSVFVRKGHHCHIPGLIKSTRSAIGETHLELLGELASECHDFLLVVAQLLLKHGNLGIG